MDGERVLSNVEGGEGGGCTESEVDNKGIEDKAFVDTSTGVQKLIIAGLPLLIDCKNARRDSRPPVPSWVCSRWPPTSTPCFLKHHLRHRPCHPYASPFVRSPSALLRFIMPTTTPRHTPRRGLPYSQQPP
nr:hypothetical protein CFP56_16882 [Quercus suber]